MAGNLPVTLTTFETELQAKINTVGGGTSIEDIISYYRAGENIPTINNTALTAEVQSRLNAVSSSTTAEEFLALAASFGKVSNTNQNDLQSALLAIADVPTNSELVTALNPIATSAELTPLAKSSELVPLATSTNVSDSEASIIGVINSQNTGGFKVSSFVGELSSSISNANPLIITPDLGKAIRLTGLSGPVITITITAGNRVVVDNVILRYNNTSIGRFFIGVGGNLSSNNYVGVISELLFYPDEVVTISTTANNATINYAFQEGN